MKNIDNDLLAVTFYNAAYQTSMFVRAMRGKGKPILKDSDYKSPDDYVTAIDVEAQKLFTRLVHKCFPDLFILGEEDKKNRSAPNVYMTVDPIDGTSEFIIHGKEVAFMASIVSQGLIVSAIIIDVYSEEIAYLPLGSSAYFRGSDESEYPLAGLTFNSISKRRTFFLRESINKHHAHIMGELNMLDQTCRLVVGKGSIGANVMALFKGEYDEIYLQESYYTPWDLYPVFCLVKSAGYRFDYKTADMLSFKEFEPIVNGEVQKIDAHKKIIFRIKR